MGATHTGYVMTLANSIIGVGILAMPFCFQKCGIILSILLLIASNLITRLSCHFLLKTAILSRKKTFEFLAFHTFGPSGKLMVELCVIGYLMGTCVTYFVVLGDLGPQIAAKLFDLTISDTLRTWVMVFVTIVCIIPLGLLKNIESLSAICTTSIIFYFCLVLKVIAESEPHMSRGDWYDSISLWRPAGVLQCLPILVMATSCQTNIFEVYDSLPNPTLQRMNDIVKSATALCTGAYVLVGFFGYVAFNNQIFSGNVMLYFSTSLASDIIKVGFFFSVACSFPLVVFPCRASLYSLLYRRSYTESAHYIPEHRFRYITISMILFALLLGLMIPSIELVIGLVGSTIGVGICILFPAACFVKTVKKNSTEKLLAQAILIFGFLLMILGTFANLNAMDEKKSGDLEHVVHAMPDTLQSNAALHTQDILNVPDIPKKIDLPLPDLDKVVENKIVEPPALQPSQKAPLPAAEPSVRTGAGREFNIAPSEQKVLPPVDLPSLPPVSSSTISEPKIEMKPNGQVMPAPAPKPAIIVGKPDSLINRDAIQKEDQEIAIAKKEEDAKINLKETKELLEQVKDQLEKQNKETQKLVLEKIEKISQKVDQIGQAKDIEVKDNAAASNNATNFKVIAGDTMPNTVVKMLLDAKQDTAKLVYKVEEPAVAAAAAANVAQKASRVANDVQPPAAAVNAPQPVLIINPPMQQSSKQTGASDVPKQYAAAPEQTPPRAPANDRPKIGGDGIQRDLLSIHESGGHNDSSAVNSVLEREKRDASQSSHHMASKQVLGAVEAVDHKAFGRDLRSINDTKMVDRS